MGAGGDVSGINGLPLTTLRVWDTPIIRHVRVRFRPTIFFLVPILVTRFTHTADHKRGREAAILRRKAGERMVIRLFIVRAATTRHDEQQHQQQHPRHHRHHLPHRTRTTGCRRRG